MTTTVNNDIDLYINGYYDTQDKLLTETKYCTNISENCDDIIKSHDGTVWNFFSDMTVDLHAKQRCIKVTKDYKIVSSFCKNADSSIGIVCRLDCCKFFLQWCYSFKQSLWWILIYFHSGCHLQLSYSFIFTTLRFWNNTFWFENSWTLSIWFNIRYWRPHLFNYSFISKLWYNVSTVIPRLARFFIARIFETAKNNSHSSILYL